MLKKTDYRDVFRISIKKIEKYSLLQKDIFTE